MKVFLYGHAAGLGAGHFARSLRLAEEVLESGGQAMVPWPGPELEVLNRRGVPLLPLPPLKGMAVELALTEARGQALASHLRHWQPEHVVVDTLPFGHAGELLPSLQAAQAEGWSTSFWWGMPYAEATVSPLKNPRLRAALQRYRGLLVYAEADAFDPVPAYSAYPLPPCIHHLGMVTEPLDSLPCSGGSPLLTCLVGSGGLAGSAALLSALVRHCPAGTKIRFVAGPLSRGDLPSYEGVEIVEEADLQRALTGASAVVARAGYNSAYSLMRGRLPVLLVPTAWPEQFQRARQLSELEGVLVLTEDQTESHLSSSLRRLIEIGPVSRSLPFRVDGARGAVKILQKSLHCAPKDLVRNDFPVSSAEAPGWQGAFDAVYTEEATRPAGMDPCSKSGSDFGPDPKVVRA